MVMRFALMAFLFCCSTSYAVQTFKIPKSAIFGHAIDNVQPISFLAPGKLNDHGKNEMSEPSPVTAINRFLGQKWTEKPEGFVVSGSAEYALLKAKERLVDEAEPQKLTDRDRLWLFFFTRLGPISMSIESVKLEDYRVDVRYKFPKEEGGGNMGSMTHFALIPLGQREAGEYDVMIPKHKGVCDSFKFYVEESR